MQLPAALKARLLEDWERVEVGAHHALLCLNSAGAAAAASDASRWLGFLSMRASILQVRVQLPAALKARLVKDWEHVEAGAEQTLPRKPSISDILQQYVDSTRGARDAPEPDEEAIILPLFPGTTPVCFHTPGSLTSKRAGPDSPANAEIASLCTV